MEQRNSLSQGTQVNRFVIDRVIGYGASCLVYEAHYLDSGNHRKEIILKECYPYNSGTTRIGSKIVWSNTEEQENAFQRFDNAYEIAAKIQNEAGAQSVSVYSLDKFTENGTQYVATIPVGKSYDKTKSDDLADIIRTALALTNAVGFYHKASYLHLDIKPSNFIATEDQTGKGKNIVLFDVDTVVAQDDIQSGNLRCVSYSKEFAAPEQKMQQIKKMCPATDLFAVGAVLFERVMNRPVDSTDSTLFATWEYDERFDAKKVNPKAKRLLTEIFHKTLAANVKRRYQSAEELAKALDELLSVVTDGKPYLISTFSNTVNVIGRRNDIDLISKAFSSGKKTVFLHGVGGIGKSTLAVAYADEYQKSYDAVLFLRYRDSLETLLNEIDIYNCETTDSEEKRRILRNLLDRNVLVIIDNFDVTTDEDEYLFDLLELRTNIIFTTRTDFSDTLNGDATQIEVNALGQSFLFELFSHISRTDITDENEKALKEMFRLVGNNTYAVELLARQITASDSSIETLAKKVADGLYGLNGLERIRSKKDGRIIKKTVPDIIRSLYNMANLNENQKQVLRNLYLLRFLNIDKQTYLEFCWPRPYNLDIVNELVESGWIQKNNRYYYMHPLVEELVYKELKPCEENCWHIFWSMRDRMNRCVDLSDSIELSDEVEFGLNCELVIKFLNGLDMTIDSNLKISINWLLCFVDRKTAPDLPNQNTLYALLSKIEKGANGANVLSETQFDIYYVLFAYWLCEYRSCYLGDKQDIAIRTDRRTTGLNNSFNMAKQIAERMVQSKRTVALDRLYGLINRNMVDGAGFLSKDYYKKRYSERPQCFEHNPDEDYFFEDFIDEWAQKEEPDEETLIVAAFNNANDKISFVGRIATNTDISLFQKAEQINYCTSSVFEHVYKYKTYSKENWEEFHKILNIEHNILKAALQQDLSNHEAQECDYYLKENFCNHCVVYAALEETENFEQQIRILFKYFCLEAKKILASDSFVGIETILSMSLLYINNVIHRLCCLDKANKLFPCIFELENNFTRILTNSSHNNERILQYIYTPIQKSAKHALKEDVPQKETFQKIVQEYEKRIKQISDANFSFKSDDE